MKFKYRLKLKKILDCIIDKINELSRDVFYAYVYKKIVHDFTYNYKTCVRYYEYTGSPHDESILLDLYDYHLNEGIAGDVDVIEEVFDFVQYYIENKFKKYRDIYFTQGEDEYGRYFEIGYLDNY